MIHLQRVTRQQERREALLQGQSVSFFLTLSLNTWFTSPPQPVRTCLTSKCGQETRSVSVHVTGVGPLLLRLMIQPQEVFVTWSTSHPGLPKPHRPCEEELTLTRPHPTLKGHLDVASPVAYPHTPRYKDLGLLSVEAADLHSDRRVLLLLLHLLNAAPCHKVIGADC